MKSKKFEKCSLFATKLPHSFPLTKSKSTRIVNFKEFYNPHLIHSKFNKFCCNPDPAQSKSSSMLISARSQNSLHWSSFTITVTQNDFSASGSTRKRREQCSHYCDIFEKFWKPAMLKSCLNIERWLLGAISIEFLAAKLHD